MKISVRTLWNPSEFGTGCIRIQV